MSFRATISNILVLFLLLNSCAMSSKEKFGVVPGRPLYVGVPSGAELDDITAEKKTIILMRVRMSLDGEPVESPADRLEFGLGSIYSPNLIPVVPWVASEELKQEGWIYFELYPGTYHFWVLPPSSDPRGFRYTMEVLATPHVQYTGLLDITCSTRAAPSACSAELRTMDDAAVRDVAFDAFATTSLLTHRKGDLETSSVGYLRVYEPPSNKLAGDLFPMAVLAGSTTPPKIIEPSAPHT